MPQKKSAGTLLQIAQLGNPILRRKAKSVENVKTAAVQKLIDDLISTVKDVDGVGIAAPQVYEPLRIFILASHPSTRYPHAPTMKPTAIINPKIVEDSGILVKDWEGCLSIPGIRGLVPRYTLIKVEYTTREGKKVQKTFEDFVARVFQHENDHLDGVVFLDRMDSMKDVITEKEYLKLMAKEAAKE